MRVPSAAKRFYRPLTGQQTITLLDLVYELIETGASDAEVVAAVIHLIETRSVHLVGQITDADLLPVGTTRASQNSKPRDERSSSDVDGKGAHV
jgi:hypothetical protein